MKVEIKKLSFEAKTPEKVYGSDFCYDIFASSDAEPVYDKEGNLLPGVIKYHTGIALQLVRGNEPILQKYETPYKWYNLKDSPFILDIDARPRSSVFKKGLSLCNCEGTIDESYTNEILVFFYDIVPSLPKYKKGDAIAQIKIGVTIPMDFIEVNEFSNTNTERGLNGFGSTGNN
jgi:dUTP pyrophosphatase